MGGVEGWGMGCGGRNPPGTASPCQPPLGKGAKGTGDADCHSQCAHWLRNDTLQVVRWGGRPQGSPLRRVTRGAGGRATARVAPTEGYKGGGGRATARVAPTEGYASISYTYIIKQYFFAMSRKFFAAEVNLRQRRGIFGWDREGCGLPLRPPPVQGDGRHTGAFCYAKA